MGPAERSRGLSIATRIFLSFAAIIAAFTFASAFTLQRMGALRESVTVLWKELVPTTNQLRILSRQIKSVEEFLAFRRPSDAQWLQQVLPGLEPFDGQYGMLEAGRRLVALAEAEGVDGPERDAVLATGRTLAGFDGGRQLAEALGGAQVDRLIGGPDGPRDNRALFKALVVRVLALAEAGELSAASPETTAIVRVTRRINRELNEAVRALGGPIRQLDLRIEEEQRTSTLVAIGIALGALVLSLLLLWVVQTTLRPIRELRERTRRIAAGDYAGRVAIEGAGEVGELAEEFNTMAASLQARDEALARQQAELLRAERLAAIGRIAAQITHEIRNPLSSIGLNAELLEEEIDALGGPRQAQEILGAIAREVERLKGITEGYLQFARVPREGAPPVDLVPVDAAALVRELLVFVEPEARQAGIALTHRMPGDVAPCLALADPQQMRQALMNVLRNAFEAVREVDAPREVDVSVGCADGAVAIAVVDRGPGIPPELRERLFEPFVTRKPGGTGLGLALTRDIMVAHGGTIELVSPVEAGRGTRAILRWRAVTAP